MDSSPSLCIFETWWGGLQYRETRATRNWLKIQGRQVKLGRGWGQEVIFDDYQISSQNDDRIAFTVDLTLLSRALKSSVSMDGDKLLVKLVRKRPSLAEGHLPYLTFESKVCSHRSNHLCWLWQFCTYPKQSTEVLLLKFQFLRAILLWNSDHTIKCVLWQGHRSAIIQDVPISQPLNRIDVQELQSSLDMAQALPRVPTKLMLLSGQFWVLCCVDLARSPWWVVTSLGVYHMTVTVWFRVSMFDCMSISKTLCYCVWNLFVTYWNFMFLQTLVQVPDLQQLQGLVDRLGKVGDVLEVGVTQYGDLHLQVSTPMVSIGSEYQKLRVIGVRGVSLSGGPLIVGISFTCCLWCVSFLQIV